MIYAELFQIPASKALITDNIAWNLTIASAVQIWLIPAQIWADIYSTIPIYLTFMTYYCNMKKTVQFYFNFIN